MSVEKSSAGDGALCDGTAQPGLPHQVAWARGDQTALAPPALPLRAGHLPLRELIDLYFGYYRGRDGALLQRLSWWSARLGHLPFQDLSDDEIHAAVEALGAQSSRYYAGRDAYGQPIYRSKKRPITTATLNRYVAALSSVLTWSIKKRIAPKGYVHPCRTIERRAENNERVRFLSDAERDRLLTACGESRWPRLRLLVLLALSTGARKSELLGLHWRDIDFERQLAYCGETKNGDPKALPLVTEVVELLRRCRGAPGALIFASARRPGRSMEFTAHWRKALSTAKIRDFRFHDLRHSCASMLAQNGATLLEIADVLGHRQLQMTKRYSHLTTGHKSALVNRVWESVHGSQ